MGIPFSKFEIEREFENDIFFSYYDQQQNGLSIFSVFKKPRDLNLFIVDTTLEDLNVIQ